jgi:hypothetical protein
LARRRCPDLHPNLVEFENDPEQHGMVLSIILLAKLDPERMLSQDV